MCGRQQRSLCLYQILSLPVGAKRVALKQAANATPARAGRPGFAAAPGVGGLLLWVLPFESGGLARNGCLRVLPFEVCTHAIFRLCARIGDGVCQQFPGMNMNTSCAREHTACQVLLTHKPGPSTGFQLLGACQILKSPHTQSVLAYARHRCSPCLFLGLLGADHLTPNKLYQTENQNCRPTKHPPPAHQQGCSNPHK